MGHWLLGFRLGRFRSLRGASGLLEGGLGSSSSARLKGLGEAWLPLKRATVAWKSAALRRFFRFLADEGLRPDGPSAALPRPGSERPLPKIIEDRKSTRLNPSH